MTLTDPHSPGGIARAKSMSPEARKAQAKKAAKARWDKKRLEDNLLGPLNNEEDLKGTKRLVKLDGQTGDLQKQADLQVIARGLGAGEVDIIKGLLKLAQKGKSENVKRQAWMDLAKILGLTKEQIGSAGGVTVIFEAPQAQAGAPQAIPQALRITSSE